MILSTAEWHCHFVHIDKGVLAVRPYLFGRHCHIFEELWGTHGPFKKLNDASSGDGLKSKVKKWKFFPDKIDYLGHVIRSRRVDSANKTFDAIRGFK